MTPHNYPLHRSDLLRMNQQAIQLDLDDLKCWNSISNRADTFVQLNIKSLKFSLGNELEIRKTLEKMPD